MKTILDKCTEADFKYLSEVLDSYISLTDDKHRKELLSLSSTCNHSRTEMIALMDKQIKYYGSSDIAYLKRKLLQGYGGVGAKELVEDVCEKLKINIKLGGSIESRLEKMVNIVVEKELFSKTPDELSQAFRDLGISDIDNDLISEHISKNGKVAILPVIFQILGPKIALGIIETIIISIIAQIIGREAAKQLIKELMKRNPWINTLGPVLWAISGVWIALDLQGPAYRKTVPICLYLGMVAMRDGVEAESE